MLDVFLFTLRRDRQAVAVVALSGPLRDFKFVFTPSAATVVFFTSSFTIIYPPPLLGE